MAADAQTVIQRDAEARLEYAGHAVHDRRAVGAIQPPSGEQWTAFVRVLQGIAYSGIGLLKSRGPGR